jgi:hypothetical protein
VIAITLNMLSSEFMINMKKMPDSIYQSNVKVTPSIGRGPWKFLVPLLWISCAVSLVYCWKLPYVGLDMKILKLRNYSIIGGDASVKKATELVNSTMGGEISHNMFKLPIPTRTAQ